MKIDLVYLWVNGNDPVWKERKAKFLGQENDLINDNNCEGRFIDNDELKYSLRSVEKFAPWINNIYIITDNQKPSWLNTDHPKIHIVDHTQILPAHALPTYNSVAIEICLANIPGLEEHFIYSNDDFFIGKPTTPNFFFTEDGLPIVRLNKRYFRKLSRKLKEWQGKEMTTYKKTIYYAEALIKKRINKYYSAVPHHNMDSYQKSTYLDCIKEFQKEMDETITHHLRTDFDVQRIIFSLYCLATNRGILKFPSRYDKKMNLAERIRRMIKKEYCSDSRLISIDKPNIEEIFKKYSPTLFCLNDSVKVSNEDRIRSKQFLEKLFPEKSSFEL